MGYLKVKGNDLDIVKLDTYQGNVSIKGKANSITYSDGTHEKEAGLFMNNSCLEEIIKQSLKRL